MAFEDVQTNIRLPSDLKDRLVASAVENKRSLSAEVASRLERTYLVTPGMRPGGDINKVMAQLLAKFLIRTIEMVGPQEGITERVFHLMRETAQQVLDEENALVKGELGELALLLIALDNLPEGRDPEEFAATLERKMRENGVIRDISEIKAARAASVVSSPNHKPKP